MLLKRRATSRRGANETNLYTVHNKTKGQID